MNCTSCFYNTFSKGEKVSAFPKTILFSSPKKVRYTLSPIDTKSSQFHTFSFEHPSFPITFPWISSTAYKFKKSLSNKVITLLYLKNTNAIGNTTIILSHSIDKNMGCIYNTMIDLCSMLKVNVISYEYTPIQKNERISIEDNVTSDLENVIDFSMKHLAISPENIILMSLSFGSIPTISVAANEFYQDISGVILINPIAYGYYLYNKDTSSSCFLPELESEYDSTYQAMRITSNVFIIHGEENKLISIEQSKNLSQMIKKSMCYFPSSGTHSNLFTQYRSKLYKKIKHFLKICNNELKMTNCSFFADLDSTKISELDITRNSTLYNKRNSDNVSLITVQRNTVLNAKKELEVIQSYEGKTYKEYSEIEDDFVM